MAFLFGISGHTNAKLALKKSWHVLITAKGECESGIVPISY